MATTKKAGRGDDDEGMVDESLSAARSILERVTGERMPRENPSSQ